MFPSSYGAGPSSSSSNHQTLRKRMARPRCPLCGSRRYRRDPDTSLIVCDQGHVLQGFREEQADDGEQFTNPQSLSQRTRRTLRKQDDGRGYIGKKRRSTAVKGIWSSERARYLFHQCLQLILRMQLQAIQKQFPHCPHKQLEIICRDLWAFYVSMQDNLQAQPYIEATHDLEMMKEYERTKSVSVERQTQADRQALLDEEEDETRRFDDQLRSMGLDADDGQDTDEIQSDFSRSESRRDENATEEDWTSEEESDTQSDKRNARRSRRRARDLNESAYVQHTTNSLTMLICILYLSLITLRVPIKWNDLRSLIFEQKIPFLHAVYLLPMDMTKGLPHRYASRLDGKRVPSIRKLHNLSIRFASDLYNSFGITFPEVNALPMLWQCTRDMLLPPTMYSASKRLLSYCDIPMYAVQDYGTTPIKKDQAKTLKGKANLEPLLDRRLTITFQDDSVPREVVLMAAVVLVAKFRYGLDGEERFEEVGMPELWSCCPSLKSWLIALETQRRALTDKLRINDPELLDIGEMNDEQLDAYLDHAERYLIKIHHPNAFHRRQRVNIDDLLSCGSMLDLQPGRSNSDNEVDQINAQKEAIISQLYQTTDGVFPHRPELDQDDLRPGDAHSIYNSLPGTDTIHFTYAQVLEFAAHFVGCTANRLADTVNALEVRLIKMIQFRKLQRQKDQS